MTGSAAWPPPASGAKSAVDHALRASALAAPSAEALVIDQGAAGTTLVWRDLERRTAVLAQQIEGFAAAGTGGRCAVEITADRTALGLVRLAATLRTRLPAVLIDPSAPDEEREAVRERLHDGGLGLIGWLADGREGDRDTSLFHHPAAANPVRPAAVPPHALVLASGGSTGRPKLVVDVTVRRPAADERLQVTSKLGWKAGQTQLVIGQLHHAAPLMFFVRGLIDGNRMVVPSRYAPSIAIRMIEEQRVQWMQATPFQLQRMAAWLQSHPADVSCLNGVLHMSAPCPPAVKRAWIDRIGAARIFEIYGATEGVGMTVATGAEWLARPGTVGKGFFTQVRVLDENMKPVPARSLGTVFLRNLAAPSAPVYLSGADRLRTSPDGFRSVGDQGFLDEDGYLYLEPRRTELINVAGENVYPAEVEAVLVRHPGVIDAAVTGVPDARLGSRPVAIVACWPGMTLNERELLEFCRARLSAFKVPRQVQMVSQIPYTPVGKIDRSQVAEMFSRG